MAVDPDHFHKGYGSVLCHHGMDIAAQDKVPIGVIAARMGTYLYESFGFQTKAQVTLADPRPGKEATLDFWVQKLGEGDIWLRGSLMQ